MLAFKNWVALALFLFGTTFLWMTRDFLADRRAGTGSVWTIVQVFALLAIVGFAAAAWGLFKGTSWWEPVAVGSAMVGLATLIPYVIGIVQLRQLGDGGVRINIAMHALGVVAVLAMVVVPLVHRWFAERI